MITVYKAYYVSKTYRGESRWEIGVFSSELLAKDAIYRHARERVEHKCDHLDDYGLILPRVLDDYWPRRQYGLRAPAVRFHLFHGTGNGEF